MWTIFKVFIEFVTILFLLLLFFFICYKSCEIIAPQPGIKPVASVSKGEILTTGLPEESRIALSNISLFWFQNECSSPGLASAG